MRTVQAARRGPRTFHPGPELRTLEDLVPKCSSAVVVLVDAVGPSAVSGAASPGEPLHVELGLDALDARAELLPPLGSELDRPLPRLQRALQPL